jgi:hypothetical protein
MKTPDEEVAERIIEKFRTTRLLPQSELKKLHLALLAGKLKAEDWKFIFETYRSDTEDADALESQ